MNLKADPTIWSPDVSQVDLMGCKPLPHLSFPDSKEAACFIAVRLEGREQANVASELGVHQSTVSRMLHSAEQKLEALKNSGRFDAGEVDRLIRKLVTPSRAGS